MRTRRFADGSAIGLFSFILLVLGLAAQGGQVLLPIAWLRPHGHAGGHGKLGDAIAVIACRSCGEPAQLRQGVRKDLR